VVSEYRRGVLAGFTALLVIAAGCQANRSVGQGTGDGAGAPSQAAVVPPQRQAQLPPGQEPKRGGTITMAIQKDLVIMNPLVATKSTDKMLRELAFESLLGLDREGRIQPNLAERWDISPDGKVYTFHLRRGVKFHNGQEMTAEDAKFAIDYSMNPSNGAHGYAKLTLVERVETPDPYTLRFTLKAPTAAFLAALTDIQSFSMLPKGSVEEGIDKPNRMPAGTGPFRFVEWQPKQQIVFERYDDYWGHKAYVDRVVFRPISDDAVRMTAMRAGDVNLVERAPHEWVREIIDGRLKGFAYEEAEIGGQRLMQINTLAPPFDNKKMRQALAYAIDKREVLHAAYFGFGTPNDQKYPRGHTWYFDGLPWPTYDPEKARALLREAGYSGQEIPILVEQGKANETEATALQAQLKRVGMNIRLDIVEYATQVERMRKGEYAFKFGGTSLDPDPTSTYARHFICEPDPRIREANNSGYCSAELDALWTRAEVETDPARRRDLFKQALTRLAEDVPELYIGFTPRFYAFPDYVKGFTTDGQDTFRWWGGGLHYTWLDK
jgi:peptide/nickel transport system substrate-binding protein